MRKIIPILFLFICSFSLVGCYAVVCDKIDYGYMLSLKIQQLSYTDLNKLDIFLKHNGFSGEDIERKAIYPGSQSDHYKTYKKELSGKDYSFIDIYIFYLKNEQNQSMQYVEIMVKNSYRGNINPEIKKEIEHNGDLIYQELKKITDTPITIEKKTLTPPYCL